MMNKEASFLETLIDDDDPILMNSKQKVCHFSSKNTLHNFCVRVALDIVPPEHFGRRPKVAET